MSKQRRGAENCLELKDLPVEILTKILSYVPILELIVNCNHVSRDWWSIVMGQTVWRQKCKHSSMFLDSQQIATSDLMVLYFNHRFGQNLVKNPDARQSLQDWVVRANGGDGFLVESSPRGSHPIQDFVTTKDVHFWTTSYSWCKKTQLIDLKDLGMSHTFDQILPDINISEWYAARFDCGCKYELRVSLLSNEMTILDEFHFVDSLPPGMEWHHVEHTFRGYGPGVQFIEYRHKGKDANWWQGHYGVKMTLSSVKLDFGNIRQIICELERQPQGDNYLSAAEKNNCDNLVLSKAHYSSSSSLSSSSSVYSYCSS